jgi:hypothetical protein
MQQPFVMVKATLTSPTFTRIVGGSTKATLGLGNVEHTNDASTLRAGYVVRFRFKGEIWQALLLPGPQSVSLKRRLGLEAQITARLAKATVHRRSGSFEFQGPFGKPYFYQNRKR